MLNVFRNLRSKRIAAGIMAGLLMLGLVDADAAVLVSENAIADGYKEIVSCVPDYAAFEEFAAKRPVRALAFHGDEIEIRTLPAAESEIAATAASGDMLFIEAPVIDDNSVLWYRVSSFDGSLRGYMQRYYLVSEDERLLNWEMDNLDETILAIAPEETGEFWTGGSDTLFSVENLTLMDNGVSEFPDTYQSKLQKLSKAHPSWKFVPRKVDAKWSEAVAAELKNDRSWIEGSADSAYVNKSESKGSGWYLATRQGVEYYMDPRNFFDDVHVFMFESMTYNESYQTEEAIQTLLSNTFMKGAVPQKEDMTYAQAFCKIGKGLDVSPLHLSARVVQEQGTKGSNLTSGKYSGYEGYYNFFNIKAVGTGDKAAQTGLAYARTQNWNSPYKSIQGGAEYLAEGYINRGQNTLYLEKWDFADTYYTHQYMQNIRAPYFEAAKLASVYSNAGVTDRAFVFLIPVFADMKMGSGDNPIEPAPTETDDRKVPEALEFREKDITLKCGERTRAVLSYKPLNIPMDMSMISFTSSEPDKVSIDNNGFITALAPADNIVITAVVEAKDKAVAASIKVSVSMCSIACFSADGKLMDTKYGSVGESLSDISGLEEYLVKAPAVPKGYAYAGCFSQPNGRGIKLTGDTVIYDDIAIYPFFLQVENKSLSILPVGDYNYTGAAIRPEVRVYQGDKPLCMGTDYTVSYKNNKNAQQVAGKQPTITIKGKGEYSFKEMIPFNILPVPLGNTGLQLADASVKYSGQQALMVPQVFYNSVKLKNTRDYVLSYVDSSAQGAYTKEGMYAVTVKGKGNYCGELTAYEIVSSKRKISELKPESIPKLKYSGQSFAPVFNMLDKKNSAASGAYDISYPDDMISPGNKRIILTGNSSLGYFGTKVITVKLSGTPLKGIEINGVMPVKYIDDGIYRSYTQEEMIVTDKLGRVLKPGTDIKVSYMNNTTPGVASLTITGMGGYTGQVTKKYKIIAGE